MDSNSSLAGTGANFTPLDRLKHCRLALAGTDEDGRQLHPGMFDSGVISLAHGDGTRRPPPEALRAGVEAMLDPALCAFDDYLFLKRFEPLERRISEMFRAGGIPTQAVGNICIECGTTRLFGAFLHSATKPGDLFLAAPTYYHSLPDWCACFGVDLACVPTSPENGYKLTVPALKEWYARNVNTGSTRQPRGIFLFNPTQTGGIYTADELSELAHFIEEHDLVVLADHVFAATEFPDSPSAAFLAAEKGMADRVVTVGGVSKSHNLANIRIGWACGPQHLIETMRRYSVNTIISVPRLNMVMALAALNVNSSYLRENAQECARRVELICELVEVWNDEVARCYPELAAFRLIHRPLAGHSLLISCAPLKGHRWSGGVINNNVDVTRFFLSEAQVAVSPAFSSGLDDCEVRICFGSVGLSQTYPYSANAEWLAVADAVRALSSEAHVPVRAAMKNLPDGSDAAAGMRGDVFSKGRELIRIAMIDRMLPAILRLMASEESSIEPRGTLGRNV